MLFVFCFRQKTTYVLRISVWSSDVCSSDLAWGPSSPGSIMKGEEAPPCGDLLRAGSLRRRCGSGAAILRKHLEGSLLAQAVQQPVHRLLGRLLAQLVLQIEKRGDVVGAEIGRAHV